MEHILAGSLANGELQGGLWTGNYSPEEALLMSVIFDCIKTAAGMRAELKRMQVRGEFVGRRLKKIQNQIRKDAAWMGVHGEESDFWRVACNLRMGVDALEMIRERFVRDRDEVLGTLLEIQEEVSSDELA